MTTTSFTPKLLVAYFTLTDKVFSGTVTAENPQGSNTKIVSGLRMDATISKSGHPSKNTLKLRVYGMLEQDMASLLTLAFKPMRVKKNLVKLQAGDANGYTTVFQGEITSAHASYKSPPNLVFEVEAAAGYYPAIATSKAKGFKGGQPVSALMQNLANEMGYHFEDGGVKNILVAPYLVGSAMQKASMIAEAADIEFGIDDGVLFITPRNEARKGGTAPLISPTTGLKEYPTYDKNGIKFTCLFNPGLRLGGLVVLESSVPQASGTWRIHGLEHKLTSDDPSSHWFSTVHGTLPGVPPAQETGGGAE